MAYPFLSSCSTQGVLESHASNLTGFSRLGIVANLADQRYKIDWKLLLLKLYKLLLG